MPTEQVHRLVLPRPFPWQAKLHAALAGPARFVVAVLGRRAGKTTAASEACGTVALDGGLAFWGAPTFDLAEIGRERFLRTFRPVIQRDTIQPPQAQILGGGSVLWRSFDRPGGSIGRGIKLAVIEEAARVKERVIYEDLLMTLADSRGKALAITTPRGQKNWVFRWYQRAMSGDPLYAVVHGPSTENPSPAVREFVEIARENMPETLFRQEVLAEFIEGEGAVFRRIHDCAGLDGYRDEPAEGGRYVIGADLAKHVDYTVLTALETETGELHGFERFRGLDWPLVQARVAEFSRKWGATVWLDSTGVGDPIFDQLAAAGVPVQPFVFGAESKSRLVTALAVALERTEISYPADDVLLGELEAFAYEELPSGKFRYSAPEGLHDDCVISLGLAVWGRSRRVDLSGYGWVA